MSLTPPRPPGSGPAPSAAPDRPGRPKPAASRTPALPAPPAAAPPPPGARVKVQAVKLGYYAHIRRRPGDVFWLGDAREFSALWMQAVDPDLPERITLGNAAIRDDHDRLLTARAQEAALRRGTAVRPPPALEAPPTGEASPLGDEEG